MGCIKAFLVQPPPDPQKFVRGVKWHARMGRNLGMMMQDLQTILKQLGMAGSSAFFISEHSTVDEEDLIAA
jgi:hypothetical protein